MLFAYTEQYIVFGRDSKKNPVIIQPFEKLHVVERCNETYSAVKKDRTRAKKSFHR